MRNETDALPRLAGTAVFLALATFSTSPLLAQNADPVFEDAGLQSNGLGRLEKEFEPSETTQARSKALTLYYLGIRQEQTKRSPEAIETYRQVLELQPQGVDLAIHTSGLLAGLSREKEAIEMMESALERNPESVEAQVAFSKLCSRIAKARGGDEKLSARGFEIAQKVVAENPDRTGAVAHLAQMALHEKGRDEAGKVIDTAAKRDVRRGDYWLELGNVARKVWPINNGKSRKDHLAKVNPLFTKALDHFRSSKQPDKVRSEAAKYFYKSQQYKLALTAYDGLVNDRPDLLQERETLLDIYKRLDMKEEMVKALQRLAVVNPLDADLQLKLFEISLAERDWGPAGDALEGAIRNGKDSLENYSQLVALRWQVDRNEDALNAARRCFRRYPDKIDARNLITSSLSVLSRYKEALVGIEETITLAEEQEAELDETFYFRYGAALEKNKKFEDAAKNFRIAIGKVPESSPTLAAKSLNYLGYMWLEQGQNIDEAGQMIERANELIPDVSAYTDSLGWFYFLKERYDDALETLLLGEKLLVEENEARGLNPMDDPENAVIYDHIAQSYFKTGKPDQAAGYMEKAAKTDPSNKDFPKRLAEYRKAAESTKKDDPKVDEEKKAEVVTPEPASVAPVAESAEPAKP